MHLNFKNYISPNGQVYGYAADGSQDHLIPEDYILVTNEEAKAQSESNAQATLDSLNYAEKRSIEYPPITDYLDGIVKGDQEQVQKYINACLAVKAKYPKPM